MYPVHGVECRGEFSYCQGVQEAWLTDKIIVNVEHDMEFSDVLVSGLVDCPHPACAYAYRVFPTALQRFIYCATTTSVADAEYEQYRQNKSRRVAQLAAERAAHGEDELLVESPRPGKGEPASDTYNAVGSPPTPEAQAISDVTVDWIEPGDEWAEWSSIGFCKIAPEARSAPLDRMFWQWLEHGINRVVSSDGTRWHIHWPEVKHHHDYKTVPDHLW